jgi:hypothetical protein
MLPLCSALSEWRTEPRSRSIRRGPCPSRSVREMEAHVAATGQPEAFPGAHPGPLSKDEPFTRQRRGSSMPQSQCRAAPTPVSDRSERRSATHQVALLRVALLHAGGVSDICVLKNVSPNGLIVVLFAATTFWHLDPGSGSHPPIRFRSKADSRSDARCRFSGTPHAKCRERP